MKRYGFTAFDKQTKFELASNEDNNAKQLTEYSKKQHGVHKFLNILKRLFQKIINK